MANWTEIADVSIARLKELTAAVVAALRNNPIAIAEGAAGAPRIVAAGLDIGSVTASKLINVGTQGGDFFIYATFTESAIPLYATISPLSVSATKPVILSSSGLDVAYGSSAGGGATVRLKFGGDGDGGSALFTATIYYLKLAT